MRGFESQNWYGYAATAKTPRPAIEKLHREFAAVLNIPEIRRTLIGQGNDVVASSPQEFARTIKADSDRWGALGRKLGISLD
jgi:tripartite-type tricarboxylate transporter receptor subunit TctC